MWLDRLLKWQIAIVDRLDGAAWPGGPPGGHGFMNHRLVLLMVRLRGGSIQVFTRTGQLWQRDDAAPSG